MSSYYANMTTDEYEELFSNFLVDSWSYSKISEFSRNEKSFEMSYIYGCKAKYSSSTVAGQAYHEALCGYFTSKKDGINLDLPALEEIAFEYIEDMNAMFWKLQKTTPTVLDCIQKATKTVSQLLRNFYGEKSVYEFDEIISIEVYHNEFLTINGVDIPLPCHAKIDLIVRTKEGKIVVIDHKSKAAFSSEEELSLSIGRQAITYAKCYESKTGIKVDEVWFIENKYSQNRDKSPQLNCFKISLDSDTCRLYEALLYEPLKRMIEAVSNPDHVYLINDNDNFVDKADLYAFWARTMISEVEEFNVPDSKKEMISKRLKKIRDASIATISPSVIKKFKENAADFIQYDLTNTNMTQEQKIEHVLRSFGVISSVSHKFEGYSSNTYLLEVSAGVKISGIHNHRLDIANVLNVSSVRISKNLVVHQGKSYVSIEFSKKRDRDVIFDPKFLEGMKIPIGLDNFNNTIYWDLNNHSTPHVLMCGATGSGKSVSILSTIEYAILAKVDSIVIFDPKYEFIDYKEVKGVNVFNGIEEIEDEMKRLVEEMNDLVKTGKNKKTLIVFDEFADAVSSSRKGSELDIKEMVQVGTYKPGKDMMGFPLPAEPKMKLQKIGELKSLEENLKILLQKGRSSGYRILSAAQRASVKVITGDAKVNFPVQICFRVPKESDSRVVIDEAGAELLSGAGDGLIRSPEYPDTVRFQAFYKPSA